MKNIVMIRIFFGWFLSLKRPIQHINFENIFSLGDCSNIPTSKTAAAVAAQGKLIWFLKWAVYHEGVWKLQYSSLVQHGAPRATYFEVGHEPGDFGGSFFDGWGLFCTKISPGKILKSKARGYENSFRYGLREILNVDSKWAIQT